PLLPFLSALATSANIGSVATLVGNPQNMIIGHFSHISFSEFARSLAQAAIVGLTINFGIVSLGFHNVLRGVVISREPHATPKLDRGLFAIVCVVFVSIFVCFFAGLNLAWTALAGAALVMVVARRDTHEVLKLVDWHLFACIFCGIVCGSRGTQRHRLARCNLSPSAADVRVARHSAGVVFNVVLFSWFEFFYNSGIFNCGLK